MRTNLPVTQHECQFPGSETLLSTTDTSSHITYANAAFIRNLVFATGKIAGQTVTQQNIAMVEQSSASANSMGDQGLVSGGGGQGVFGVIAASSAFTPHANA